jgi:alpha-ketoglutarate-dependent taurine dioxygenase
MSNLDVDVRPVAGRIGAEITGVDLSSDLDDGSVEQIRTALLEHRVVFFRGQDLDSERLIAFGERFGPVTNGHPTIPGPEHNPQVQDIQYPPGGARANSWHSDVSFVEHPPLGSVLRAIVVPPYGGDTLWANTVAGYEDLPAELRALADSLWAVHTNDYDYVVAAAAGNDPDAAQEFRERFASTVFRTRHPVVQIHPETGERALLLGAFARAIEGISSADAQRLLAIFQESITSPENTVRWRWSPGDVAFWDNRTTQHYGVADFGDLPRQHERITISGSVPVSIDGRSSESLTGSDADFTRVA